MYTSPEVLPDTKTLVAAGADFFSSALALQTTARDARHTRKRCIPSLRVSPVHKPGHHLKFGSGPKVRTELLHSTPCRGLHFHFPEATNQDESRQTVRSDSLPVCSYSLPVPAT